jgi:hypothetical protein
MKAWYGVVGVLAWCAGLASAQSVDPEQPVGRIKTLTGQATVTTLSQKSTVAVGLPVYQGSVIETGKASSLGLTFRDGTVLALGAETRLTVEDYLYNPNQNQYAFGAQLGKGTLNYISGAIAKHRPQAVQVKTPTAVIGVRGTQFVVKAEDAQ